MFTRIVQHKPPRSSALLVMGVAALAAVMLAAVALAVPINDSGSYDVNVANKNLDKTVNTTAGAIVEYIGDSSPDGALGSAGTGVFVPFVRLQASPTEKGFNTNAPVTYDAKTGTWTHAILVSQIPIVTVAGKDYWELFVDINDSNNAKHISLNDMEIWFTTNPNLTGYVDPTGFPSGATKQYDFSGSLLFNDVNQGSGRGDVRYLVPLANIPMPSAGTYFVLWSKWGTTSATYNSDGGFEEWKVKAATPPNAPTIATTLSATTVNIGDPVHDSATLTGATATAGGTVTYSAYAGANTCSGTDLLNSTVTVTNGVVPDSGDFTPSAAGTYSFQATYSGDLHNLAAFSDCTTEQLVVNPNQPTLDTTPNGDGDPIGTVLNDTATLSGASNPTGSIDFALFGPDDTGCVGPAIFTETVALTGNSASTTTGFTTLAAGTYAWTADYAGDNNNLDAHSGCTDEEVLIVPNTPGPHSTPVVQIKDTFSVDGFAAPAAGAPDVLVGLYSAAGCAALDQIGSDESFAVPAAGGTLTDETSFVAALAGDYYFKISYAGDANNASFSSCEEHVGITIDSLP